MKTIETIKSYKSNIEVFFAESNRNSLSLPHDRFIDDSEEEARETLSTFNPELTSEDVDSIINEMFLIGWISE